MAGKISPEKAIKRNLARKARSEAFEALDMACLQGRLDPNSSAHWADLILKARSKEDLDNLASVLQSVGFDP